MDRDDRFRGLILGTAVGDALGYPAEGLSRKRIAKLFGGRWKHRFLFGRGMVSDDTDHSVFVAQALLAHPDDVELFKRHLARSLRWWLLGLPIGLGRATLYSIVRLWCGVSPSRSGIYSAGNGAAMRAAILGAYFPDNRADLDAFLVAQTKLTHSDPKALIGAAAVAAIAAWVVREDLADRPGTQAFHATLRSIADADDEWTGLAAKILGAAERGLTVEEFADSLGLSNGVSGYVYHTVPIAVYFWYRHFGDFESTLVSVLNCGGDTDPVGAFAGELAGTVVGESGIPKDWVAGLADWPRHTRHLRRIAERVSESALRQGPSGPVKYFWPAMLLRNAVQTVMTYAHLFRRMAPPY